MKNLHIQQRERAVFNTLKKEHSGKDIQPSYLRIDATLTNTDSKFKFDIRVLGTETKAEVKLDRNDTFICHSIGLFLVAEVSAAVGAQPLQSYPNQQVFPAVVGPPAFTPGHLETVYNGKFFMKQGTKVWIESLSTQNFRKVPQTQQSSATNYSQWDLDEMTYKPGQLINLYGNQQNEIYIEIPTFSGIAMASQTVGTVNKVVLFPIGYLIKGTTKN